MSLRNLGGHGRRNTSRLTEGNTDWITTWQTYVNQSWNTSYLTEDSFNTVWQTLASTSCVDQHWVYPCAGGGYVISRNHRCGDAGQWVEDYGCIGLWLTGSSPIVTKASTWNTLKNTSRMTTSATQRWTYRLTSSAGYVNTSKLTTMLTTWETEWVT